ncbi:Smr/MutS family protein [Oricola indica]|uniref:Smr/MutS family protein n=1 Tax=Oricola indica TaxID=2872591 RepID=UPI003CCB8A8F
MKDGKTRRKLSDEETILWYRVERTVTPLRDRAVVRPEFNQDEMAREFREALSGGDQSPKPEKSRAADIRSPIQHVHRPPAPKSRKPEPLIDRPTTRKIAKGRISIDSRVDLHAMTQDQAHDRLYAFLASARSRGDRHVLVVTGKGRSPGSEGVLKRMVPVWLNGPRFSELVSGYSSASRHHGGEGAIYVRLRRLSRPDGSMRR